MDANIQTLADMLAVTAAVGFRASVDYYFITRGVMTCGVSVLLLLCGLVFVYQAYKARAEFDEMFPYALLALPFLVFFAFLFTFSIGVLLSPDGALIFRMIG